MSACAVLCHVQYLKNIYHSDGWIFDIQIATYWLTYQLFDFTWHFPSWDICLFIFFILCSYISIFPWPLVTCMLTLFLHRYVEKDWTFRWLLVTSICSSGWVPTASARLTIHTLRRSWMKRTNRELLSLTNVQASELTRMLNSLHCSQFVEIYSGWSVNAFQVTSCLVGVFFI